MSRFRHLNPYERHKLIINEYILTRPGHTKLLQRDTSRDKRDIDVIRENHKFLWDDEEADTWEKQLAKKYYDKLFKEYCICDLSRYKENKIAMRWRVEKEVISGKGQFVCGNKVCPVEAGLRSWEVNFAYIEHDAKKNALVKLRLCPECSTKLNYHSQKREVKRMKKSKKQKPKKGQDEKKRKSSESGAAGPSSETDDENKKTQQESRQESSSSDDEKPDKAAAAASPEVDMNDERIWSKSRDIEEISREEEFEKYLEDLLL